MASLESDIDQLEVLLKRLEKEYDLFFVGQLRREPAETEGKLLAIVRTWSKGAIQNNTLAFRFNTVVARYNSLRTIWGRRMREREEGRGPAGAARAGARRAAAEASPAAAAQAAAQRSQHDVSQYLAVDPSHESRHVTGFFEHYRHLREQCGESVEKLRPDAFQRALADRVAKIKEQYGCEAVLIRAVAEGGRTRIVAKPYRRAAGGETGP